MERHKLRELREKVNLFIYDSKTKVLGVLSVLNFIVSLFSIGVVINYYGFNLSAESKAMNFFLIQCSFAFYIFRFLVKIFFDFDPVSYLKKNWIETVIISFLIFEGIYFNVFGNFLLTPVFKAIGWTNFEDFSIIFIQLYVFIILISSILKQRRFNPWTKIHPGWLFVFSIISMVLIGGILLMLPEMSRVSGGLSFNDAMFTSMSSVSVTGLSTIDIPTVLTFKGQVVILVLMKLGGLNTIAFGALMLVVAKFGVGIKYHEVIEDFVNRDSILNTGSMLTKIVIWSSTIEVLGIILLFIGFGDEGIFADSSDRMFHAVFHGISGFNNAGLSSLQSGMMHPDVISNSFVHAVLLILFFLGGFGMIYIFDLFEFSKLRERMKLPWKTIEFGTKISLYFTLALLLFGAIVFYIFEYDKLAHNSFIGDLITMLFQSMTTRNAGFNIIDTASLSLPVIIVFLFLMFVGASSGSAGGGIRTSTFAVMWASLISTIRGKKHTEIFKRTIPNEMVLKAYAIFLFFVIGNIIGTFALAISEQDLLISGKFTFVDIVFEHVSAASTVGLSRGLTPEISETGKYILMFAMFIGRVGTLTIAYILGSKVISTNYKYPIGHTMLG